MRWLRSQGNNTTLVSPGGGVHRNEMATRINIALLVFSLLAAFLSLMAILIIATNRKLRQRTSNKFLLNLFSADFGVTLLMVIYHSILIYKQSEKRVKNMEEANEFHIVISTFMFLSIVNRITVTLDRAIAVKKPFYYEDKFNGKMVIRITVLQYIVTALYLVVLIVTNTKMLDRKKYFSLMKVLFISVISLGFLALTVSNTIVYIEARKQIKTILKLTSNNHDQRQSSRQKEYRIVRINVGMVLVFVLCWTPFLVSICQQQSGKESQDTMTAALFLVAFNYVLDPIIYVSLSKDVKEQITRVLRLRKQVENANSKTYSTSITSTL